MKASHIISLIQKNYTTVAVNFAPDEKTYIYKMLLSDAPTVWDLVIIPSAYKHGFAVGQIQEVHKSPKINVNADWDYKWVVAKIDVAAYNELITTEQRFAEAIDDLEQRRIARIAVDTYADAFPVGSAERNDFDKLVADMNAFQVTNKSA